MPCSSSLTVLSTSAVPVLDGCSEIVLATSNATKSVGVSAQVGVICWSGISLLLYGGCRKPESTHI
jgi:hypothetical protein